MSSAKLSLADYDPKDPDPWLALNLDKTLPIAPAALLAGASGPDPCSRSAFAMTSSDEADIAIAAINGVTWPRMAIGTATAL